MVSVPVPHSSGAITKNWHALLLQCRPHFGLLRDRAGIVEIVSTVCRLVFSPMPR